MCRTGAVVCRLGGPDSERVCPVPLGARSDTAASLLYLGEGGICLAGDAATRHLPIEPHRVVGRFLRRVGDDVPMVVGDRFHSPQELTAALVSWAVDRAAAREGGPAEHVAVTHPVSWGAYRTGLLRQALCRVGLDRVTLLPEPVAAAEEYAVTHPVPCGHAVAVLGLGATVAWAAVLRRTGDGVFEVTRWAESSECLGGDHFDDVLFAHLRAELGRRFDGADPADPQTRLALHRLRQECTEAKERLSTTPETVVAVNLPHLHTQVRITRPRFHELIRPAVQVAADMLRRTVLGGGVGPDRLDAVLLVGGSCRVPLVAEVVGAQVKRPVVVAPDPATGIARGAALTVCRMFGSPGGGSAVQTGDPTAVLPRVLTGGADDDPAEGTDSPPPRPPVEVLPLELPERRSRLQVLVDDKPGVLAGAVLALGVVLTVAWQAGLTPLSAPDGAASGPQDTTVHPSSRPVPPSSTGTTAPDPTTPAPTTSDDEDGR